MFKTNRQKFAHISLSSTEQMLFRSFLYIGALNKPLQLIEYAKITFKSLCKYWDV